MSQQASHHLDLLQWFLGDIKELNCRSATRLLDIEVEDTGVAILQGKNGALGVFEATVATRPKDLEGSLSILGEKGSIVINGFAVNELHTWNFEEPLPEDEGIRENVSQAVPNVYGHGHAPYLRDVVHYLQTGERAPALVTPEEGIKNIALLTAL
jgi:UDP-N-acetyl-2-amino-2-deoxyglucuronate dehydrogenase